MSKQAELKPFNFGNAVVKMREGQVSVGDLTIWGGRVDEAAVKDFIDSCALAQMPYRIWEYAHRIEFSENANSKPDNYELLERGRIFGAGGDLSLRRDGTEFLWHFVGPKDALLSSARRGCLSGLANFGGPKNTALLSEDSRQKFAPHDFWERHSDLILRRNEETALLWGDYQGDAGRWQEDRVGWADLDYPLAAKNAGQRVNLVYETFTDGGQIAFVWFKKLEEA